LHDAENRLPGGAETGRILAEAVRTFEPDHPERTIPLLLKARAQIATIHDPWASDKLVELNEAIALCAGLWLDANTDSYAVAPGATVEVGYTALNRSVFPMVLDSLTLEGMGGASRTDAHRAALESNQPVNAQLKFAVPADQPYSQPFWLREPKQGDTYTISDQRMVGLPDDPPLPVPEIQLAPLSRRLLSVVVDGALMTGAFLASAWVAAHNNVQLPPVPRAAAIDAASALLAIALLYLVFFFVLGEATPGMRYARIALTTFEDRRPSRAQVRCRLGALFLSLLPAGLGIAWALFDEDHLTWHDRLTRTYLRNA